jgi:hypothetical protein
MTVSLPLRLSDVMEKLEFQVNDQTFSRYL